MSTHPMSPSEFESAKFQIGELPDGSEIDGERTRVIRDDGTGGYMLPRVGAARTFIWGNGDTATYSDMERAADPFLDKMILRWIERGAQQPTAKGVESLTIRGVRYEINQRVTIDGFDGVFRLVSWTNNDLRFVCEKDGVGYNFYRLPFDGGGMKIWPVDVERLPATSIPEPAKVMPRPVQPLIKALEQPAATEPVFSPAKPRDKRYTPPSERHNERAAGIAALFPSVTVEMRHAPADTLDDDDCPWWPR